MSTGRYLKSENRVVRMEIVLRSALGMRIRIINRLSKITALFSIFWVAAGCGTISTVASSDSSVERKLTKANTYCVSIPRIYSGVFYDSCHLHAKPEGSSFYYPDWLMLYGVDVVVSGVTDTVMLPYTIYKQVDSGSIKID